MSACIGHSRFLKEAADSLSLGDLLVVSKACKMRESLEAQTLMLEHSQPSFSLCRSAAKEFKLPVQGDPQNTMLVCLLSHAQELDCLLHLCC